MRVVQKDWLKEGEFITAEHIPFEFMKDGEMKILSTPMVFVRQFKEFVLHYLDLLAE